MKQYILLALLLSGCASSSIPPIVPGMPEPAKPKTRLHVDPMLLEPCTDFSNIQDNPAPLDVLMQHSEDRKTFLKCSEKHRGLAAIMEELLKMGD